MEFIYKYVSKSDGIVRYVGRTNDLDERVLNHCSEPRFKDEDWEIEYFETETRTDSEALESHFIEVYKTYEGKGMNKSKARWGICSFCPEVEWKKYKPIKLSEKQEKYLNNKNKESYLDRVIAKKEKQLRDLEAQISEKMIFLKNIT